MTYLSQENLLRSSVVANSTMNRDRGLAGVNSYARELGFDPVDWLLDRTRSHGRAVWYDACCGNGVALREARQRIAPVAHAAAVTVVGVDLVGPLDSTDEHVIVGDVATYTPDTAVDLITCVHGLHYLGDKLGVLRHFYDLLSPDGILVANLDPTNVIVNGTRSKSWPSIARHTSLSRTDSRFSNHVLWFYKRAESLDLRATFVGAAVSETPNYTGITVIDSWYQTS